MNQKMDRIAHDLSLKNQVLLVCSNSRPDTSEASSLGKYESLLMYSFS